MADGDQLGLALRRTHTPPPEKMPTPIGVETAALLPTIGSNCAWRRPSAPRPAKRRTIPRPNAHCRACAALVLHAAIASATTHTPPHCFDSAMADCPRSLVGRVGTDRHHAGLLARRYAARSSSPSPSSCSRPAPDNRGNAARRCPLGIEAASSMVRSRDVGRRRPPAMRPKNTKTMTSPQPRGSRRGGCPRV